MPSLSAVYLTCSEPGFIPNLDFILIFFSKACLAIDAALERSSYDEFVQDPIRPHFISVGQPSDLALSFISFTGVARSGVNGPLICGISESKSISITSSKYFSGLSYTSWSALRSSLIFEAALTTSSLSVDFKYLSIDSS